MFFLIQLASDLWLLLIFNVWVMKRYQISNILHLSWSCCISENEKSKKETNTIKFRNCHHAHKDVLILLFSSYHANVFMPSSTSPLPSSNKRGNPSCTLKTSTMATSNVLAWVFFGLHVSEHIFSSLSIIQMWKGFKVMLSSLTP